VSATDFDDTAADLAGDLATWRMAVDRGTFEETYQALEAVVARLERGRLRLDESVACYELGVRLARRCDQILDSAELRVSQLDASLETADDDHLHERPYEDEESG
jgi:exodeoxyribonuclease VII small subunit